MFNPKTSNALGKVEPEPEIKVTDAKDKPKKSLPVAQALQEPVVGEGGSSGSFSSPSLAKFKMFGGSLWKNAKDKVETGAKQASILKVAASRKIASAGTVSKPKKNKIAVAAPVAHVAQVAQVFPVARVAHVSPVARVAQVAPAAQVSTTKTQPLQKAQAAMKSPKSNSGALDDVKSSSVQESKQDGKTLAGNPNSDSSAGAAEVDLTHSTALELNAVSTLVEEDKEDLSSMHGAVLEDTAELMLLEALGEINGGASEEIDGAGFHRSVPSKQGSILASRDNVPPRASSSPKNSTRCDENHSSPMSSSSKSNHKTTSSQSKTLKKEVLNKQVHVPVASVVRTQKVSTGQASIPQAKVVAKPTTTSPSSTAKVSPPTFSTSCISPDNIFFRKWLRAWLVLPKTFCIKPNPVIIIPEIYF